MMSSRKCLFLLTAVLFAAAILLAAPFALAAEKSGSLPESHFTKMGDYKLHYWSLGSGPKALVLIHGWCCDASFWQGQLDALASGSRRVIALDLLGHGLSDKPKLDYSFDVFIKGIRAVLDHAGVKEAVLCGHSMGGGLARYMAQKDGAGIKGLIVVDGAIAFPPKEPAAREEWRKRQMGFVGQFKHPGYRKSVQGFIFAMLGPSMTPGLSVRIVEGMLKTPSHVGMSAMRNFSDPAIWPDTPLDLPALVVYAKTPHITDQFRNNLKTAFPAMEYHELEGVGHFYTMEKPGLFNKMACGFLAKHKLPGR